MAKMVIDDQARRHLQARVARIDSSDIPAVQETINKMLQMEMPAAMAPRGEWYVGVRGYKITCLGNLITSVLDKNMSPKGRQYRITGPMFT